MSVKLESIGSSMGSVNMKLSGVHSRGDTRVERLVREEVGLESGCSDWSHSHSRAVVVVGLGVGPGCDEGAWPCSSERNIWRVESESESGVSVAGATWNSSGGRRLSISN